MRPLLRSIPGVAEINSTGGYVKQYQVLVDPDRLRYYDVRIQDVCQALARNNANSGGGVLPQRAEQYLVRGVGLIRDLDDIRNIVLKEYRAHAGVHPRRRRGRVRRGRALRRDDQGRLHRSGRRHRDDDPRRQRQGGRHPGQGPRRRDQRKAACCPAACKIVPYYDRSELVDAALWTVVKVLLEGMFFVVVMLFLFLGDLRSSLIVVATLILTPLATFMVMNRYGLSANLMSLGASRSRSA